MPFMGCSTVPLTLRMTLVVGTSIRAWAGAAAAGTALLTLLLPAMTSLKRIAQRAALMSLEPPPILAAISSARFR